PLAVRTITALATSPFFTLLLGSASRTETTITSPIEAYLRLDPPSTLMQNTLFAPELSATSSTLDIWIIAVSSFDPCDPGHLAAPGADVQAFSGVLALLQDFHHAPALVLGGRLGLGDADPITFS